LTDFIKESTMSRFVQLHLLTNYPPSNLNRDDTGRPKTALMGDALRLRVSSQSQKRAWRTSNEFHAGLDRGETLAVHHVVEWDEHLNPNLGSRTKEVGKRVRDAFVKAGVPDTQAKKWARGLIEVFGEMDKATDKEPDKDLDLKQLVHFSPEERQAIDDLVTRCVGRKEGPTEKELELLRHPAAAVDIAMFGRMLAKTPAFNVEAAVQVAHAVTVHKAAVEDDYFSAVDDLNKGLIDQGAAHIGERSYGAGLFYLYICIDRELLENNLGANKALAAKALDALVHAVTKVSPTGMQNSHASRAYASYVLAERGNQQPRSLVQAFLNPIKPFADRGMLDVAVKALVKRCENFDKVYGKCADDRYTIDVETGEGSLDELAAFVKA
jgi:CRISPR system Cascade subunit CasC